MVRHPSILLKVLVLLLFVEVLGDPEAVGTAEFEEGVGNAGKRRSLATDATRLDFIVRYNFFRCKYDTPFLTWNTCLENSAQTWADGNSNSHSNAGQMTPCEGPSGENIANGWPTPADGVNAMFTSEVSAWESSPMNAYLQAAAHLTAILWKTATLLGCARGTGNSFDVCRIKGNDVADCTTPNNIMNNHACFPLNVMPKGTKSDATCLAEAQAWGLGTGSSTATTAPPSAPASGGAATTAAPTAGSTAPVVKRIGNSQISSEDFTAPPSGSSPTSTVTLSTSLKEQGQALGSESEKREFVKGVVQLILDQGGAQGSRLQTADLPFPETVTETLSEVSIFSSGSVIDTSDASLGLSLESSDSSGKKTGVYCPLTNPSDNVQLKHEGEDLKVNRNADGVSFSASVSGGEASGDTQTGDTVELQTAGTDKEFAFSMTFGSVVISLAAAEARTESQSLEAWEIALIVVGAVVFIGLVGLLAWHLISSYRKGERPFGFCRGWAERVGPSRWCKKEREKVKEKNDKGNEGKGEGEDRRASYEGIAKVEGGKGDQVMEGEGKKKTVTVEEENVKSVPPDSQNKVGGKSFDRGVSEIACESLGGFWDSIEQDPATQETPVRPPATVTSVYLRSASQGANQGELFAE
uniref:SCP domain-containing protein n=1 Tax=Chromera velia CCMP2878 TaxID=1169474 RepID=A0A0G4F8E3_9ALVE|eukprot:Cvel_15549.t1-p1 / transcript=Cvel_15549.t1 / gene=Cvel_15549 / organism=Chromera_velia_CCMP2878 / gene_product=Protein PRY1, putative / transcript_product=Protein PRY1, putative / location=Cvel_scaffold1155:43143-45840(-) / protein_length=638 / sequence_SO=supercontig / SO=protein_coding / is_pseudo=false